jgi:N-carbamoylputrescine amidase
VRVGAIQIGPAEPTFEATLKSNVELVGSIAREQNLELVVMTELAMAPYFCSVEDDSWFSWAEAVDGPSVQAFGALARQLDLHIALPIFEKTDGVYYNSVVILGPDGQLVDGELPDGRRVPAYRKIHLPTNRDELTGELRSDEPRYFTAGSDVPTFPTAVGRLGSLICFDKRFSELWRLLGIGKAEIVLNPVCTWGEWRNTTYPLEVQVAAMNNQYFVAGTSKAGMEDIGFPHHFAGGAHIAAPDGVLLSSVPVTIGGAAVAECDLAMVAKARHTTPIYRDRRVDAYGELLSDPKP